MTSSGQSEIRGKRLAVALGRAPAGGGLLERGCGACCNAGFLGQTRPCSKAMHLRALRRSR